MQARNRRESGNPVPSNQAKHSSSCVGGRAWTPFARAAKDCSCAAGPLYYIVVRRGTKADRSRVGRNSRDTERALRKIAVSVDDGGYQPQANIGFSVWADRWLDALERKESTVRSYRPTMEFAKETCR
jgi:hypothetical protein